MALAYRIALSLTVRKWMKLVKTCYYIYIFFFFLKACQSGFRKSIFLSLYFAVFALKKETFAHTVVNIELVTT